MNLVCQFCGKSQMWISIGYNGHGASLICDYSKCKAEWDRFGNIVKMPKGQRRKAVEK